MCLSCILKMTIRVAFPLLYAKCIHVSRHLVKRTSASNSGSASLLKRTCLHDLHIAHGGKMVPFAGWSMPVQYADQGVAASHHHTRKHVSVFDVTHMLQMRIHGPDRVKFMESLVVSDVAGLTDNHGTLSLITTENGGIIDDLIVTKTSDYLYLVLNAGCAEKDLNHIKSKLEQSKFDASLDVLNMGLVAVQGPEMVQAIQPAVSVDLSTLTFMTSCQTELFGVECRVTRCGYTGEDGVEISLPEDRAAHVVEQLLSSRDANVKLAGLGARDSLRLEAGLCLYGNDIDEHTTPVEAALTWTIGKNRRSAADFPGADIILKQIKDKTSKKRVGFLSTGPPPRTGAAVFDESTNTQIGTITSGCPSPSLVQNVAMGYVDASHAKNGTPVSIEVRKNRIDATITKMPFVASKYYTGK